MGQVNMDGNTSAFSECPLLGEIHITTPSLPYQGIHNEERIISPHDPSRPHRQGIQYGYTSRTFLGSPLWGTIYIMLIFS